MQQEVKCSKAAQKHLGRADILGMSEEEVMELLKKMETLPNPNEVGWLEHSLCTSPCVRELELTALACCPGARAARPVRPHQRPRGGAKRQQDFPRLSQSDDEVV